MDILLMFGDIASYYTEIRHSHLHAARDWLRRESRALRGSRSGRVCITRRARGGVRWGRSYNKEKFAEMELELVWELLAWEVNNCMFTWGEDVVLKQTWGIAMGTPPAPANAVMVAAYFEKQWRESLMDGTVIGTLAVGFRTARYMDDTASAVQCCLR